MSLPPSLSSLPIPRNRRSQRSWWILHAFCSRCIWFSCQTCIDTAQPWAQPNRDAHSQEHKRGCSSVGRASDRPDRVGRFDSPVRQGIFLPEPTFSADSLTVSVQSPCAIVCMNICVHSKDPKHLATIALFGYRKIAQTL